MWNPQLFGHGTGLTFLQKRNLINAKLREVRVAAEAAQAREGMKVLTDAAGGKLLLVCYPCNWFLQYVSHYLFHSTLFRQ